MLMLEGFRWRAFVVALAIAAPAHIATAADIKPCPTNSHSREAALQVVSSSEQPAVGNHQEKPKVAISAEVREQAKDLFEERCATCHGKEGRGDGPAAANLKPRPRNFHSRMWQKSISDETITRAIVYGGAAVGVSAQMAPNPDLEDQPALVAAMVERIRKWSR